MKKWMIWAVNIVIFCLLAVGTSLIITYMYNKSAVFRSLFGNVGAMGDVAGDGNGDGGSSQVLFQQISMYIFTAIVILQIGALYLGCNVISAIKREAIGLTVKLKKLENAEIFLDLPLYIGLFGTVSSFVLMAVNPQTSRLTAYSSTLIGIVFSIVLRLILVYPYRSKMLSIISENETTGE